MTTSELIELNITKPDIQRIINNNKVTDIIKQQLDFFKKNNFFNFTASSPLNIHYIDKTYMLVDGQHRLLALEKLYNEYSHNILVYIMIVNVKTKGELEYNYNMINKNTPLPDFSHFQDIDKKIPEIVFSEYQLQFPKIWSKTTRSRRPHIFPNHFQEALGFICQETKIDNSRNLKTVLEQYNEKLRNWEPNIYFSKFNVNENQYKLAKEYDFYLGLFSYQNEDYGFHWARKIVEDLTGKQVKSKSSCNVKKKKNIPKKVKNDSWDKHIGENIASVLCLCCRKNLINSKDFHAGHVQSEKNGGKVTVDNIVPICAPCNYSMNSTNMEEYVETHYPDNYNKFIKREYSDGLDVSKDININSTSTNTSNWTSYFIS